MRKKKVVNVVENKEQLLLDCKAYFEQYGANDWMWCNKCHRLGHNCFNICGVAMKVLTNKGLVGDYHNFGHERVVSADEYIAEGVEGSKSLEEYIEESEFQASQGNMVVDNGESYDD